jgi:hypothetical protein
MKQSIPTAYLLVLLYMLTAQTALPQSASSDYHSRLESITNRVESGDSNALFDASTLPAANAVPYLAWWTKFNKTPQQRDMAIAALKTVDGYAGYLNQDMAAISAQGRVPIPDFQILESIDTPEAAAVIAPYLFDFKTIVSQQDDVAGDSNVGEALYTLELMKLPGAPPPKPLEVPYSAYLMQWQKWAIAKSLVPKDWSSRVGAPKWMLGMEAMEKTIPGPVAAISPRLTASVSPPLLTGTNSPVLPASVARPSAVQGEVPGRTSGILIAVVILLLIIGGIFTWKRRS